MSQCQEYVVVENDPALYYCQRADGHHGSHYAEIEWSANESLPDTEEVPVRCSRCQVLMPLSDGVNVCPNCGRRSAPNESLPDTSNSAEGEP
jgi:hypothetical protein